MSPAFLTASFRRLAQTRNIAWITWTPKLIFCSLFAESEYSQAYASAWNTELGVKVKDKYPFLLSTVNQLGTEVGVAFKEAKVASKRDWSGSVDPGDVEFTGVCSPFKPPGASHRLVT
jgi:hypothetical protein